LVVEANAVLSDPQRRERYDNGEDEDGMSESSGGAGGVHMTHADLAELFAHFHGGGPRFAFGGGGGGRSHGHGHGF
jgi:DnaJ homolog subfamily C member 7